MEIWELRIVKVNLNSVNDIFDILIRRIIQGTTVWTQIQMMYTQEIRRIQLDLWLTVSIYSIVYLISIRNVVVHVSLKKLIFVKM